MHILWKSGLAAGALALALGGAGLYVSRLEPGKAAGPFDGTWKVVFLNGDKQLAVALVAVEAGAKPPARLVAAPRLGGFPRLTAVEDVRTDAGGLHFTLQGPPAFRVAAYPPAGEDRPARMAGSVEVRNQFIPAWLERTGDKELVADKAQTPVEGFADYEKVEEAEGDKAKEKLLRDVAAKYAGKPAGLYGAQTLAQLKAGLKAPEAEVREAADGFLKEAAAYGPEMEAQSALQASRLLGAAGHKGAALAFARRAEKLLPADAPAGRAAPVLKAYAAALKANGEAAEAAKVAERLAALDRQLDAEFEKNAVPFAPTPFGGRKGKSDRVVLVELFTGAHCPPCVAADVAFDALLRTYKPGQAALLQYHLHVPRPDPLTTADSEARSAYYGDAIQGTPTYLIDGEAGPPVGGPAEAAREGYEALTRAVNARLEEAAGARLKLVARRAGDAVTLHAEVTDLKKPGDKVRLRFVLAEEVARYAGTNGQRLHHHVVRAFPGGVDGFPLKEESVTRDAAAKVADLVAGQDRYLTDAGKRRPFLDEERPLDYRRLRAFAFVQDDATKEVLQAAQVDLGGPDEGK